MPDQKDNNYGIPKDYLTEHSEDFNKQGNERSYEYYADHPDELSGVNWDLEGKALMPAKTL